MVIGGGISGLACAHRLRDKGVPVLLFEQGDRFGGVIYSARQDEFLFELGPQSFQSNDVLLELIGSRGLNGELLRADPRASRYLWIGGRFHRAPMALPRLLSTSLLSAGTKWRLFTEPLRRTQPPVRDESVADFVRRKFGRDLLENLAGPFVSGIYAGDPEKLSLRAAFPSAYRWEKEFGSVIRGAMKSRPAKDKPPHSLCAFREGNETLPRAVAENLGTSAWRGAQVQSIRQTQGQTGSGFEIEVAAEGRGELVAARALVVATDTQSAAGLLAGISAGFAPLLSRIEYAPVAVLAAGYRREQVRHRLEGFGFLVPRKEGLRMLGVVWNSSLFPGSAPDGMVAMTVFAGGVTDPEPCQWSEERIAETIHAELSGILGISGPPVTRIVQRYARALPQYNLGHTEIVAGLRQACATTPGIFLAGNYLEGPAIGACVEQASRVAESVAEYLALTGPTAGARAPERRAMR